MQSLEEIGRKWNTDKASRCITHEGKESRGHDYLRTYERFLAPFRDKPITMIEIGMGPDWNAGASIKMWAEYFNDDHAQIVGLDIREVYKSFTWPKCKALVTDASVKENVDAISSEYQPDIIIDDGSHLWSHQNKSFLWMFPQLKPGGIFIIEDIHTSFGALRDSYGKGEDTDTYTNVACLQAKLVGNGAAHPIDIIKSSYNHLFKEIDFIVSLPEAVIVQKKSS